MREPPAPSSHVTCPVRSKQTLHHVENQITDLRSQLERTESQLEIASSEKTKLLDLLSAEKDEKREMKAEMRALMPPPEERVEKPEQTQIKLRGWLQRLIGVG